MNRCMVTTADNMFNPFVDFDKWLECDIEHKHYTCEWLSIFAKTSIHLEDYEYNDEVSDAIDMLLQLNPSGIHFKVYEDEADEVIPIANKVFRETTSKISI